MVTGNVKKYWETGYVKCVSTTVATLITSLRGGESLTLKSHESSDASHKIGPDRSLISVNGYMLDSKETMTLTLPISFGRDNIIEIYALPENANKYISFFKLIDLFVQTAASD